MHLSSWLHKPIHENYTTDNDSYSKNISNKYMYNYTQHYLCDVHVHIYILVDDSYEGLVVIV